MENFWDNRYAEPEYAYGETPNRFFESQLNSLTPGVIILPCEGEGRNGIYAAGQGWKVLAFDQSTAGKEKAMRLSHKKGVHLDYVIQDAALADYGESTADVVALFYAHFPPEIRKQLHRKASAWLKPGGRIILEAFHPNQLQNHSGGPKDIHQLYTPALLQEDFMNLKILQNQDLQIELEEGKYHQGKANVIRFVAIK